MRSPGARILVRREEGLRASPRHLLRLRGGGPGRADGSPAAERGAGQQPQHQGRRSLSRAAQLVLPSPDHPGHGATSLRSLDGPFPPPERAEVPHGQRRRRGARAGCWLRGARGRSRGDRHMAHDCPPHSSTPVGGRGVKITVPAHVALALASQQTRLQELGLLAQEEGLSELWGLGSDATHSHSHRVPLRRGAGRGWSGERESETSARLAPSLTPDGSGWLWRATGLPVTRVYTPGTLACG